MSRFRSTYAARAFLLAAGLAGAAGLGCQTTPAPIQPAIRPRPAVAAPRKNDPAKSTAEQLAINDPCAVRLHDISGQMLWFYAVNHRLPETLDELKTTADPGADVDYTCPVTHKPYAYAPQGLQSQGQPRRLVVYDAVPNSDGSRWAILIGDLKPAQPLATWVVQLPEVVFRTYLPALP